MGFLESGGLGEESLRGKEEEVERVVVGISLVYIL